MTTLKSKSRVVYYKTTWLVTIGQPKELAGTPELKSLIVWKADYPM